MLRTLVSLAAFVTLSACVRSVPARGQNWYLAESDNIRVQTDLGARAARELATQMEAIVRTFRAQTFQCAFEGQIDPIEVIVFAREWDYLAAAPERTSGVYMRHSIFGEEWTRILMHGRLTREARRVFQHELTHKLLDRCVRAAPGWVNEGLAELFETAEEQDGVWTFGKPAYLFWDADYYHRDRDTGLTMMPRSHLMSVKQLAQLESMTAASHDARGGTGSRYGSAWALTHMLMCTSDDLRSRFGHYLAILRAGKSDEEARALAFRGIDIEASFGRYVAQQRYPYYRATARPTGDVRVAVRKLPEAQMQVTWAHLLLGRDARAAEQHARFAITELSPTPDAHLVLAAVHAVRNNRAGVLREVDAALRLDPDHPKARRVRNYLQR